MAVLAVELCYQYNTNLTWRNREVVEAITNDDQFGYALENTTIEKLSEYQTLITIRVRYRYLFRSADRSAQDYAIEINNTMDVVARKAAPRINRRIYDGMEQNLPFPTGHITLQVYTDNNPNIGMYCTRLTQYD